MVVVSVCVVYCVLCYLQNNPEFSSFAILSHISKNENYELCILAGFFVTTGKKSSSRLSGGCAIIIMTRKKSSSRLSGGCTILITTGKKILVICLAGARSLLQPEKKVLVVCLAGCAVVSVFGSSGK